MFLLVSRKQHTILSYNLTIMNLSAKITILEFSIESDSQLTQKLTLQKSIIYPLVQTLKAYLTSKYLSQTESCMYKIIDQFLIVIQSSMLRNAIPIFIISYLVILGTSEPYCQTLVDYTNKHYILPSESSFLQVYKYFRGYNLTFQIESDDQNYVLTPPINPTKDYIIRDVQEDQLHVAIDVLSDNQYQYKQQGVLLSKSPSGTIFVRFGALDENNGLQFKQKVEYRHFQPINCFDILMLEYNIALVDCQKIHSSQNTDVILIVDGSNIVLGTQKSQNIKTQSRKLLSYRTQNQTLVLSILLSDFIGDRSLRNQSYINTYLYNHTLKQISFFMMINWQTLGDNQLTIADIDIDPFGYIYLADNSESEDYLICRFKINHNATLDGLAAFDLNQKPTRLSTVFVNNVFLIEVATSNSIIQIDWTNQPKLISSYELPQDIGEVIDVQMNQQVIMLQTSTGFYFYNIKQYKLRELLHQFQLKSGVVLLDKANYYGVFVTQNLSRTIMLSPGSLLIWQSSQKGNNTMKFRATSVGIEVQKTCETVLEIIVIVNKSLIYVKRQPPTLFTMQNPANLTLHLESYYSGALISYHPKPMPNIKYYLHFVNQISYSTLICKQFETAGTFSISDSAFYRVSKIEGYLVIEICEYSYPSQNIDCLITGKVKQSGDILAYFFMRLKQQREVLIYGYTTSQKVGTINFIDLKSLTIFLQPVTTYNNQIPIKQMTVSEQNLMVVFQKFESIAMFKVYEDSIKQSNFIDRSILPQQVIQQIGQFLPSIVKIGNNRLIFVLNGKFVLIMRLTSIDVTFIDRIILPILDGSTNTDLKVFMNTLIVVNGDQRLVLQYNIANIYDPILIQQQTMDTLNFKKSVNLENHLTNCYTFFIAQLNGCQYIHFIKAGVPAISSYYYNRKIATNSKIMSVIIHNSLLILAQNQIQTISFKIESQTTINIIGHSIGQLLKTLNPYGIVIESQGQQIILLGTLRVVNYQTIIKSTNHRKHQIFLPRQTKQSLLTLPNQLFTGSIAHYQIQCQECQNKIDLISYTYELSRSEVREDTQQFIYFQDQNNIIWALGTSHINVMNESLQVLTSNFQICTNCICTNFIAISYQFVIVFCEKTNSHQFMSVVKSINNIDLRIIRTFPLPNSLVIDNCFMMKSIKNKLFILDNNIEGTGKGQIKVFKVTTLVDDVISIQFQTSLDYSDFGLQEQTKILGFQIVSTEQNVDARYFSLIVSLDEKGIGYLCYNSNDQTFVIVGKKGRTYDLNKIPAINNNILDNNGYRQIRHLKTNYSSEPNSITATIQFQTSVIITSTLGRHFQLLLAFQLSTDFQLVSVKMQNAFNKYGSQKVLNWMSVISSSADIPSNLAVAHYNQSTSKISITIYPIPQEHVPESINFRSSVSFLEVERLCLTAIMMPFDSQTLIVYEWESSSNVLYNVSTEEIYLLLNYSNINQNISSIQIIASNDYSHASVNIAVTQQDVIPNERRWLMYVIIGILGMFLLGIIYGIIRYLIARRKSKKQGKISQITLLEDETKLSKRGSINLQQ